MTQDLECHYGGKFPRGLCGQDGRKAPGEEAALAEPLPSVGLLTAPISQVRLQELSSCARGHARSSGTQSWPHPRPGPPGPPCPLPSCTHDRSPHDCSWSSAPPRILGAVPPRVGGGKGRARRGGDHPGSRHRLPGGRSSLHPHRPPSPAGMAPPAPTGLLASVWVIAGPASCLGAPGRHHRISVLPEGVQAPSSHPGHRRTLWAHTCPHHRGTLLVGRGRGLFFTLCPFCPS